MILHGHYRICIVVRHLEPNSILSQRNYQGKDWKWHGSLAMASTNARDGRSTYVAQNLKQTPTMVAVTELDEELFSSLMDP